MSSTHRYRGFVNLCRLVLLCLACVWGGSFALELSSERLQSLAASRYGAKGAKSVGNWLQLMRSPPPSQERDKLTAANDFWNQALLSAEDITLWKQADYWATPLESLGRGAGDCEDYVIGKYFTLLAMGVPANKLRFIYVRARVGGPASSSQVAHMVLGYYDTPNAVPLVLDSLISTILPATQRRDLTPVFSFNADGVYVDGKPAAPVDRLSRWRDLLQRMERDGIRP
ncbi:MULTISPECIES: transglutaminase-like cysteine peptidase [Achromobacter]|uniref:Transglutaminase-like cysteine peptidase n=1 Tax=Achromobacter spanius TaxID=217203 RepID=A0ABY8GV50_9BURK|nr:MULTISPECIES: transglutaminase-like cysteine peptidase [Achromobacter]WAI82352.1 transglutaminase-like cysteine peptidase [Achromobacter spanius]WEX92439.1 transglutaminase-like cysteine peptidase [Achromobacter sp. SS2-2022]WFP08409.1 transglutaminase-like cysteine peptidase [Achromobacter spanius]